MKKLTKLNKTNQRLNSFFINFVKFIFTNSFLVTALTMLLLHLGTGNLIYLKVATLLTIGFCLIFLSLTFISLIKFGLETLIVEMEVKFLNLLLYSSLITSNFILISVAITSLRSFSRDKGKIDFGNIKSIKNTNGPLMSNA